MDWPPPGERVYKQRRGKQAQQHAHETSIKEAVVGGITEHCPEIYPSGTSERSSLYGIKGRSLLSKKNQSRRIQHQYLTAEL